MRIKISDIQGSDFLPKKCDDINNSPIELNHDETYSYIHGFNESVSQLNSCDVWLDEEILSQIIDHEMNSINFHNGGLTVPQSIAKLICANAHKILRVGK